MKIITTVSRILLGLVFIFSGFVKGVDPLGTAYKLDDYFVAYGIEWLMPAALAFSVLLVSIEFLLGFMLVFNMRTRLASWGVLLLMSFFTVMTFYDALENPVPDCGCFGEAIILTNWETFYKNVFLMIPTLLIFGRRNRINAKLSTKNQSLIAAAAGIVFILFSLYNYRHLPLIDFRNWQAGNKMYLENPKPLTYYLTFKNKETGEEKEYLASEYPFNDSTWVANWQYVDKRVVDPNAFKGHDLQIIDSMGNDRTEDYIRNPDYQFILVANDIEKSSKKDFEIMNTFANIAGKDGYEFIALASGGDIYEFSASIMAPYPFYQADEIVLKTMVRANPGLILMKDGIVLAKWHNNDFPAYRQVKEEYMNAEIEGE